MSAVPSSTRSRKRPINTGLATPVTFFSPSRRRRNKRKRWKPSVQPDEPPPLCFSGKSSNRPYQERDLALAVLQRVPIASQDLDLVALKQFARHGGPNLEDLRAYPSTERKDSGFTMTSTESSSHLSTSRPDDAGDSRGVEKPKKKSADDPGFQNDLADYGVYFQEDKHSTVPKPKNFEDIKKSLHTCRNSMSDWTADHPDVEYFQYVTSQGVSENAVAGESFTLLAGRKKIPHQPTIRFNNLEPLDDGSDLNMPGVDWYDGSKREEFDLKARKRLRKLIEPSKQSNVPCLPNFVAEFKALKGNCDTLRNQGLYNGALAAQALHEVRRFAYPESVDDDNAYVIVATYQAGQGTKILKLFTVHPTRSTDPDRRYDYHMFQLTCVEMTKDEDAVMEGFRLLRNARDWAKKQRDAIIASVNRMERKCCETSMPEPTAGDDSQSTVTGDDVTQTSLVQPANDSFNVHMLNVNEDQQDTLGNNPQRDPRFPSPNKRGRYTQHHNKRV